MTTFIANGAIIDASTTIETPIVALSKAGGPGATDEILGSVDVPAARLSAPGQLLSGRVIGADHWDRSRDVTVQITLALDQPETNGDTLDIDFRYIYATAGLAAGADLAKTPTALVRRLTANTVEGLADETLYILTFTLDRNDADNGYIAGTSGGFGFSLNVNAASSITSINVVAVAITYPTG